MYKLNLSIIVVTYNCENYIIRFLKELTNSLINYCDFEILINDNDSVDNTFDLCGEFSNEYIKVFNSENVGFAKANNKLIRIAKYENILLLNPDVFGFSNEFWDKLYQDWDRINPCFVKLLNEDLTIQQNVGEGLSVMRYFKRALGLYKNPSFSEEVVIVQSGIMAFLLLSRKSLQEVGLIAEEYYMYGEDHDWLLRAWKKGFRPIFNPKIELIHIGGASAKSRWRSDEEKKIKLLSEKKLIKKNFSFPERELLLLINKINSLKK